MIEARVLTKTYKGQRALSEASFSAGPGRITALLGANGAGKSTLLKILCGFHLPDSGDALICGTSLISDPVRARNLTGFVPEDPVFYDWYTAGQSLEFCAGMVILSPQDRQQAVERVIQQCGLSSFLHKSVRTLSRGMRQRLSLAQALVHCPPVLLLDEPSNGLDPAQQAAFRSILAGLAGTCTILLSTHNLTEAEQLGSDVLILHRGALVAQGSIQDLLARSENGTLESVYLALAAEDPV